MKSIQIARLFLITLFTTIVIDKAQAAESEITLKNGEEIVISIRNSSSDSYGKQTPALNTRSLKSQTDKYFVVSMTDTQGISARRTGKYSKYSKSEIEAKCSEVTENNPNLICEPNYIYKASQTPNDPRYSETWGMEKIRADEAWNISVGLSTVKVAVVDTGVQYNHPDLAANISINTAETPGNGLDDDGNGYIDDYYGYDFVANDGNPNDENEHGTHVAGTIGATGNNSIGVAGVNWSVGIIPVRVLDAEGSGTLAGVAQGIDYAVARGASVINLSLGGPSDSQTLKNSISRANAASVLVAAAAGNEGEDNDFSPSYPANYSFDNIISVAASDIDDNLADFSNYGVFSVHLAAPGVEILSTYIGSSYEYLDGTSMATPHVAGVAALIKAVNPSLGALDIKNIILSTVDTYESYDGLLITGGRLNAGNAVRAAIGAEPLPPASSLTTITIKESGKTTSSKTKITGTITNSMGAVASELLYLVCNKSIKSAAVSSSKGKFTFKLNRDSRKTISCTVQNEEFSITSNKLKIKSIMSASRR